MTIAILATGDEIVHGDTLNTNGQHIAQALSSEGLSLGFHLSCSDKESDLLTSLEFLAQHHDILILIGGLGPTTDDLTRFALAQFTGEPLVTHMEAVEHIKNRLLAAKVTLNEGNLQQSLFPEKAVLLPNPHGTALGCYYQWQGKSFILLPGPPRECLPMFHEHALPLLQKTAHSNKAILKWFVFGLAESEMAELLEDALVDIHCQTGYRLDSPYLEFKVRCANELVQTVETIVNPILAPHIITANHKKASQSLYQLLIERQQTITIIDDVTGGLLQSTLTTPASKQLLHFTGDQKTDLTFYLSGLEEYWSNEKPGGSAEIRISYDYQGTVVEERHQIPFRSPLVLLHAVEWLSFRLFHIINQLHQGVA